MFATISKFFHSRYEIELRYQTLKKEVAKYEALFNLCEGKQTVNTFEIANISKVSSITTQGNAILQKLQLLKRLQQRIKSKSILKDFLNIFNPNKRQAQKETKRFIKEIFKDLGKLQNLILSYLHEYLEDYSNSKQFKDNNEKQRAAKTLKLFINLLPKKPTKRFYHAFLKIFLTRHASETLAPSDEEFSEDVKQLANEENPYGKEEEGEWLLAKGLTFQFLRSEFDQNIEYKKDYYQSAQSFYEEAAQSCSAAKYYFYLYIPQKILLDPKNANLPFKLLIGAAKKGFILAQAELGRMYLHYMRSKLAIEMGVNEDNGECDEFKYLINQVSEDQLKIYLLNTAFCHEVNLTKTALNEAQVWIEDTRKNASLLENSTLKILVEIIDAWKYIKSDLIDISYMLLPSLKNFHEAQFSPLLWKFLVNHYHENCLTAQSVEEILQKRNITENARFYKSFKEEIRLLNLNLQIYHQIPKENTSERVWTLKSLDSHLKAFNPSLFAAPKRKYTNSSWEQVVYYLSAGVIKEQQLLTQRESFELDTATRNRI